MIVLDTSVLLYAVGGEHALREPSRRVVEAVTDGRLSATTSVEVIQEFAHVAARRNDRSVATRLARRYAALLSPLLVSTPDTLEAALSLYERHSKLGAFDALLAATATAAGCEGVVSADRAFAGIRGLRHLEPGATELEKLL